MGLKTDGFRKGRALKGLPEQISKEMYKEITCLHAVLLLPALIASICGAFCLKYPEKTIKLQQYFYLKINWRMEPVSWDKEVRNTRSMGIFILCAGLAALILIFIR